MIFTLILSLILSLVLGFYVIAPLLGHYRGLMSESLRFESKDHGLDANIVSVVLFKGFADENELRQTLHLRDCLLQSLVFGHSDVEAVNKLSRGKAMEALVSLCERLRLADIPVLPQKVLPPSAANSLSLSANIPQNNVENAGQDTSSLDLDRKWQAPLCLFLGFFSFFSSFSAGGSPFASVAFAQQAAAENAASSSSAAVAGTDNASLARRMPGLVMVDGVRFASIHQFVLSPRVGKVVVYYLTAFPNADQSLPEVVLGLPFPQGFSELKLSAQDAVLEQDSRGYPLIKLPLKGAGVTELRAEFVLDAPFGTAAWQSEVVPRLPGTFVVLMPEQQSALRNMTEKWFPDFNLWPARIVGVDSSFRNERRQEEYDVSDPNYYLLSKMPPEYTRNLIRSSSEPAAYPQFSVVGIVPNRLPLYLLAALMGSFLLGTALFTMRAKLI